MPSPPVPLIRRLSWWQIDIQMDHTDQSGAYNQRCRARPPPRRSRMWLSLRQLELKWGKTRYSIYSQMSALRDFVARYRRLFVLTGAGCSTDSGIPDYRDAEGNWKRSPPVSFQAFMGSAVVRQRYWARSMAGWPRLHRAQPNAAHQALARLEKQGRVDLLLTQNVDRLHQAAGSVQVIDLHGRIDQVRCMHCAQCISREELQTELLRLNAHSSGLQGQSAPDGDADLDGVASGDFSVPSCPRCGGLLKPDVVFFGESVPPPASM